MKKLINDIKKVGTNNKSVTILNYDNEYWVVDGFHRISILYYYNTHISLQ